MDVIRTSKPGQENDSKAIPHHETQLDDPDLGRNQSAKTEKELSEWRVNGRQFWMVDLL